MTGKHDYSFRNRDFQAVPALTPTPNAAGTAGCRIDEDWEMIVPASDSRLARYFSGDLCRFFADAFGVCLRVRRVKNLTDYLENPRNRIFLMTENDAPGYSVDSAMEGAFRVCITDSHVIVVGKTERGTARGVYYLEDSMRLRGECSLLPEENEHAPLFSPRMTHSGTELDTFPDNFLEACAHAGMDAIIVYAGHPDTHLHGFTDPKALWPGTGWGYCDFNNLVWRAEGFGLDVYVYSHMLCDVHPDDPSAEDYYDQSFGTLFRNCHGIKGVILVGETFEFPSRDPHTCGVRIQLKPAGDSRVSPGWYPCSDYPQLVNMVKNTIQKYNPEADIVFWSYNWGWSEKAARLALIENLPKDITLLVTFDMWESFIGKNGKPYTIDDYSISFEGPSRVFLDEAEKAKEMGIRLYAMANTGGRTWDNGAAPYLPVPQQWQKRYEALCRANADYGLCGLMENHHYGWLPSFLSLFSKNAFTTNGIPNEEMLCQIARRDYGEYADMAMQAWAYFSEGISNVVAAAVDQYGPYRCGPTYPLLFDQKAGELNIPSVPWAWHKGGGIWNPVYPDPVFPDYENTLLRYSHVKTVKESFRKGLDLLETAAERLNLSAGSEISRQIAVARFLYCTYVTTENVIGWNMAKKILLSGKPPEGADAVREALGITDRAPEGLAQFMKNVAALETENVSLALTCWKEDSSIGFEASMEYVFNDEFAKWKNAETVKSLKRLEQYLGTIGTNE